MAIKKNNQKFTNNHKPQPQSQEDTNLPSFAPEINIEISEKNIKSQQALDKLRRQKLGYPDTEILEAGAIAEWLEDRKLQLIEDADDTRNHSGFTSSLGLVVSITGFVLSGGTMTAISPVVMGLGVIGYATSLVDSKARINKLFLIPFVNISPKKLVEKLSPDLRSNGNDLPEEYEKLDYLPKHKAHELLMLTDYQSLVIQLLEATEKGKRFAIYQILKQAAINYDLGENAKAIASLINKNLDSIAPDPTLDKRLLEEVVSRIAEPEEEEAIDINAETIILPMAQTLPLDEVRLEELEANNKFKPEDLVNEFAREPRNTMVVGAGGTGKGIIVSHLLRGFKEQHPEYLILVFDPKGDCKEKGYFDGVADKTYTFDSFGKNPKEKVAKYDEWWNKFYSILKNRGGKILLVIDEATTMGQVYGLVKRSAELKGRISELPNLGGSSSVYNMIIAQNTHVEDLGINKGIQNNYTRIGLISLNKGEGQSSFDTMQRTRFVTDTKYTWNDVRVTAEKSPRKRAFYFSKFECWLPMPEMTNYSGYDRDNEIFSQPNQLTKKNKKRLIFRKMLKATILILYCNLSWKRKQLIFLKQLN